MKKISIFFITLLVLCLFSCDMLFHISPGDNTVNYYEKIVQYSRPFDDYVGAPSLIEETYCYNNEGRLDAVYKYEYKLGPKPDEPYYVLDKMNCYIVNYNNNNKEVSRVLEQYYTYEYKFYKWLEYDGTTKETYEVGDYYITGAKAYTVKNTPSDVSDDEIIYSYKVEYLTFTWQAPRYKIITDYSGSTQTTDDITNVQTSTYTKTYEDTSIVKTTTLAETPDHDDTNYTEYSYETEKFFSVGSRANGEANVKLSREFACWYKDGLYTRELYHFFDAEDSETVYQTKYEWSEAGNVYSQNDYKFTLDSSYLTDVGNIFSRTGIKSFKESDVGTWPITDSALGDLVEDVSIYYDDYGNKSTVVRRTLGTETERMKYRYDGSNIVSEGRYINGASYAYDLIETRYSLSTIENTLYTVMEQIQYRHSSITDESITGKSILTDFDAASNEEVPSIKKNAVINAFKPIRSNHDH